MLSEKKSIANDCIWYDSFYITVCKDNFMNGDWISGWQDLDSRRKVACYEKALGGILVVLELFSILTMAVGK